MIKIEESNIRLIKTVQVLRNISQYRKRYSDVPSALDMSVWQRHMDCGTYGCAVGTIANIPWFNNRGLFMHPEAEDPTIYFPVYKNFEFESPGADTFACAVKIYKDVARFFGISNEDTYNFFTPVRYGPTFSTLSEDQQLELVAERIEDFLIAERGLTIEQISIPIEDPLPELHLNVNIDILDRQELIKV